MMDGVACVASLHVMEHFSKSEPFCGNNTMNSIHRFDIKSNSAKLSEQLQENSRNISNPQSVKEGSGAEKFSESQCTGANVIAATSNTNVAAFVVEHVDRPKKSSRWEVVEDNAGNSRIDENELGVGLRLYKHGGGDDRHVSGSVQEDGLGIATLKNAAKERHVNQSDRSDARGGSQSRRILDEVRSRSGHFESNFPIISVDRHSIHHKPSRTYYHSHGKTFELPSSRSHTRFSRRSESFDKGYPERNFHDRRSSYEERNGFRKSGGEKYHSRHSSHYSHSHEHRQFHRNVGWRENRWNSNYRQSQRGRSDHLSEDCKGRVTSHSGGHSRSSFSSTIKDSRSKDVEAQPGISPSQTLASEQSERSYEERNGFRKSGGEKYHSRHTSHYSHSHEHRQFHRNVGWRENRWNSNYRQSQRGRSDHLSEDCKGRVTSHSGVHSRSSFSSTIKDSRSKDVEAQPGISPSQTLASEQSERFPTELQKDSNNAHFSEQNALPEEICNFEEPRCRGWSYIDHLGFERGPSTLGDLKRLVEDGLLQSDHLIKREGTSEWVTVEHAASPMPFGNLSLPTSRGFLKSQIREFDETSMHKPGVATNTCKNVQGMEKQDSTISVEQDDLNNDRLEDFHIEERIEKLLQGVRLIPGMENEILSETLGHAAPHVNCDMVRSTEWEGSPGLRDGYGKYCNHWRDEKLERGFIHACNVSKMETTSGTTMYKELDYVKDVSTATGTFLGNEGSSQASGRWPSKGGEVENFARTQNVVGCDRPLKEKAVLNDGVQLCDIWKSGLLDPRREAPSCSTQLRQLQLPAWAYCWKEERSDPIHRMDNSLNVHMQAGQASSATPKAHASTPKSQVSTPITQISTPRGSAVPICGCDGLKATKPNNGDLSKSIIGNKSNSQISAAAKGLRVCKAASSSQFEMKSVLKNNSAVFKEFGPSAWELCTNSHYTRHTIVKFEQVADQPLHQHEIGNICDHRVEEINVSPSKVHKPGMPPMPEAEAAKSNQGTSGHLRTVKDLKLHMGEWYYCNGAGHEKGPLTFTELQMLVSEGILHKGSSVYRKTDNTWVPVSHDIFTTLHSKVLPVDSLFQPPGTANTVCRISEQSKFEDCSTSQADNCFHTLYPQFVAYAKGKLHEHVMKFYKSRDFSAAIGEVLETWMAPKQSKNSIDTQISSLLLAPAPSTADNAVTSNHMDKPIDLKTSEVKLGEIPSNTITGQLGISHIISRSGLSMSDSGASSSGDPNEETHCKVKSLEQINDKIYGTSKSSRTLDIRMSDDSQGRDIFMPPPHETDQGEPMDVDDFQVDSKPTASAIHQRSRYPKRIKLSSSGRSAKCNLEDGSFKGEASMKSPAGYHGGLDKSIKKHLATTLKEIMGVISVNTKNFFLREAAEIEDKIKGGSYSKDIRAGLKSFEDDIFLFCRKAFQEYKRDSPEHLAAEEIFKTAHRYISNLEKKFEKLNFVDTHHKKSSHPKEILRSGKDKSKGAFYSSSLNVKKRLTRAIRTSMKRTKRRRGMSYSDCSVSIEGDVSDCESWRISKQKKRCCLDSETETPESSGFLEEEFQEKDDNNDMENSDLDMKFVFDGEDGYSSEQKYATEGDGFHQDTHIGVREWGARMTRESLVPPVTRKYEVIEEYAAVADEDEVNRKMRVCLPKDYEKKLTAAKDRREIESAHLETLELKEYRPRKRLGDEVLEQEVYGIDPYTHNLLLDTMPKGSDFSLQEKHAIIEEVLLRVLNEKVRDFTGTENTPMEYPLQNVVERMIEDSEKAYDSRMCTFFQGLLRALQNRQPTDKYIAYRKGLGVVCNKESGFEKDDFVVDFLGEVYPAWRWFEKQDGIRSLQKNSKDPVPEFYNINLERPKGDGAGYDLVVVDAMHKANYASRICHSCRPNCEAKVTAIDGQYQIGIYTLRPIQYGEEITFDYNSLTESKEEYEVSVCLCGSHGCRGSYFNLAVAGGFQKVLKEFHGLLHRHQLLLEACMMNSVTDEDISDLRCAGLGTCLLSGLPNWAVAFSAGVVRFMNFERSRLPEQILKHAIKLKKKAGVEILLEYEKRDAEIQAEGVYNQRLQSLAITLDKVRYIIRKLHQDPTKAPPPLRKLKAAELVSLLWKGEQSLVEELLRCMGPYVDAERLNRLKQQIHTHDPSGSKNVAKSLRESLLWLRDELRGIPSSCRSRHDAAADLIHLYAHTKYFFTRLDYGPLESPPLYISPLDLGPKYADRLGSGFQEWKKIYSKDYALGQLMYWYVQTFPDPGYSLNNACRGCLVLPDITSCYAKTPRQQYARGYGSRQQEEIIRRMEQQPQKQWPKGEFWEFNNNRGLFGSPVFDVVMDNSPLDKELMKWLKTRPAVFDGPWDH